MASPVIALVASDNDYGGNGLNYKQTKLTEGPKRSSAVFRSYFKARINIF